MNPLALLPYALAAYGGISQAQQARAQGISGLGSLIQGGLGALGGYNLGQLGGFAKAAGFGTSVPTFANIPGISSIPGISRFQKPVTGYDEAGVSMDPKTSPSFRKKTSILDILKKKDGEGYDPVKVGGAIAGLTYLGGAFDQTPIDIFTPGYNTNYMETRQKRSYSYIDPVTGQEREYEKVYVPESNPNRSTFNMSRTRITPAGFNTGGIANINKFNEGGVNYLPSKMTHDENDANNYVRASGYVEDGAGVGDKDEDTMLAQLADGEFVTRADGVLGAGIIAGANPNSMKDMREKGAAYFYEQQKRYKRVFDLLKEKNGNSEQKTN